MFVFVHHLEKNLSESDSNDIVSLCLSLELWCGLCYSLILRMIFRTISLSSLV